MNKVDEQKIKLQQKKNRLAAEELRLKLKEQKARTRQLIELGGLVVKAGIDVLPLDTLYGGLLSLSSSLETDGGIRETWAKLGKAKLEKEKDQNTLVIVKFEVEPVERDIRDTLKIHGMRWNKFRSEWCGNVENLDKLKEELSSKREYSLEVIEVK
ncbi:MAG: conjugal transfer protein TraD [Pseudomonadota bacterium]